MNNEEKKSVLQPLLAECSYYTLYKAFAPHGLGGPTNCLQTFEIKYNRCYGDYVKRNN